MEVSSIPSFVKDVLAVVGLLSILMCICCCTIWTCKEFWSWCCGSTASNAESDEQSVNSAVCPNKMHAMVCSDGSDGKHYREFICHHCGSAGAGMRWFCSPCDADVCFECIRPPPELSEYGRDSHQHSVEMREDPAQYKRNASMFAQEQDNDALRSTVTHGNDATRAGREEVKSDNNYGFGPRRVQSSSQSTQSDTRRAAASVDRPPSFSHSGGRGYDGHGSGGETMRPSTSHLFGAVGGHHNEDDYGGVGGGDDDTFDNDSHPSHREAVVGSLDRMRGPTPTVTHAELDEPYVLPAGWSAHLDDAGTGGVYYCFEPSGYTTWDPPPSDHQSGRRTSSSSAPHSHKQQPQQQHLEKHWHPGEHTHPVDHDSHATSSTSTLATQDHYYSSSAPTAAPSAGSSGLPPTRGSTASPLAGNKPALAEMQEAKAKAETVRRAFEAALRAPLNADSDGRTSEHQQGSQHEQQRQQHAQEHPEREQQQREQHQRGGSEYHHSPPEEEVHELPPGWSSHVDGSNGNAYYCFEPSGYVTWDHPSTQQQQQQQQQQQTPQHQLPSAAETHPPSSHPHHTRKSRDGGGGDDDDDDDDDKDNQDATEGREGVTLSPPRLPHETLRRAPSRSSLARYGSQLQPALGASSFSPPTEKQLREKRCEDAFRAASQHAMELHRASAGLPEMMRPPPLSRRGAPPPPHTYLSPQQVAELEGLPPLKPPWVRGVHRHQPADSSACLDCLYFFNAETGVSTWDEPFECSPNAI